MKLYFYFIIIQVFTLQNLKTFEIKNWDAVSPNPVTYLI